MLETANTVKRIKQKLGLGEYKDHKDKITPHEGPGMSNCTDVPTLLFFNPGLAPYLNDYLDEAENVLSQEGMESEEVSRALTDVFLATGLTQQFAFAWLSQRLWFEFQDKLGKLVGKVSIGDVDWLQANANENGLSNVPEDIENIRKFAVKLNGLIRNLLQIKSLKSPDSED